MASGQHFCYTPERMIITYYGKQSFKVSFGDTTLSFDPVSKKSKEKESRFGADVTLISVNHPDFNGAGQNSHGEKEPFIISGPGEYEVKEVFIKGFPSVSHYDGGEYINTVYFVELEGMKMCFLGAIDTIDLPEPAKEVLDEIDILFVPIGSKGVLSPSEAAKLSARIEPRIVIPMIHDEKMLKKFIDEAGNDSQKPVDKLTLKKKDLIGKEGEVITLKAQN